VILVEFHVLAGLVACARRRAADRQIVIISPSRPNSAIANATPSSGRRLASTAVCQADHGIRARADSPVPVTGSVDLAHLVLIRTYSVSG
jgi:hypothetical protein